MKYTYEQWLKDLEDPEMPHLKDKDRFVKFYEELGRGEVQRNQQTVKWRIEFIEPAGRILDLGCHSGFNTIYFAKHGYSCVGVDISKTLIEAANYRLAKEPEEVQSKCEFICADILDLGQEFFGYETVLLTELLEHCIDHVKILEKTSSLMSTKSLLYISVPTQRWGNYSHVRGVDKKELIEISEKVGLYGDIWEGPNCVTYAVLRKA
jgi:2-polyprenyl-3-methyl-5-hydroxy-6-metoxy-1,4-benzoquinol methylase